MRLNKIAFLIGSVIAGVVLSAGAAYAISILPVQQGGTGWGFPGNIKIGAIIFGGDNVQLATSTQLTFATTTNTLTTFSASTTNLSVSSLSSGNCVQTSTGGLLVSAGAACGSGGGGTYPFTPSTFGSLNVSATSSPIMANAGLIAATSTFGTIVATSSITDNALTSGNCVQAGAAGLLTTAAAPCGSGSGGTYPFTPSTFGINVSATSTAILDYPGLIAATSTIGTFTASSSITNQGVKSALVLNSATGLEGAYAGSNPCSANTAALSISATGVISCTGTFVPQTTQVNTTYPLQGGGALSGNLTLTTAFGTTTTWGLGNNGFVITGATGIPFIAASSTLNLPNSALANSTISGVSLGNSLSNLTINNGGAGVASGGTYNGSAGVTISYNSIGAVPTTRNVNTTFPLQGGGALSADLTLTNAFSTTSNSGMSQGNLYVGSGGVFQTSASSSIFGFTPASNAVTVTVAGTANQITSSNGAAQALTGNVSTTFSLPNHVIFPNDFLAILSSTTNSTTTGSAYFTGITQSVPLYVDSTGKLGSAGTGVSGNCVKWGANNTLVDQGSGCGGAGSTPGAPVNSIQFNSASTFGGASDFFFNSANGFASIGGSTTPQLALFSVAASSTGAVNTTIFAVASSSSGTATTTLFSVTPPSGNSDIIDIQTLAGTNVLSVSSIGSTTLGLFGACSGTNALTTDSSGNIICGAITGSGGAAFPFTPNAASAFFNQVSNSTTTQIHFGGSPISLSASSTAQFANSSTTQATFTGATWLLSTKNAIQTTDANGLVTNYAGSNPCGANTAALSLSALGVISCTGTFVPQTTSVNTTFPLQGGGALSGNLTLTSAMGTTSTLGIANSMVLATNNSGVMVATSTPTANSYLATTTTATSTFQGAFEVGTTTEPTTASGEFMQIISNAARTIGGLAINTWTNVTNAFQIIGADGTVRLNVDTTTATSGFLIGSTTVGSNIAQIADVGLFGNVPINNAYFQIASSSQGATTTLFLINNVGHVIASSTSPVLSACGTSPSMIGDDTHGEVTVGATATGCTITFGAAWSNKPVCTIENQTLSITSAITYTTSATAITVSQAVGLGGDLIDYMCEGVKGSQ